MNMPVDPYPGWVMGDKQPNVIAGDGFYYVDRQILVETGKGGSPTVLGQLQKLGEPDPVLNRQFADAKLPLQAYNLPPGRSVPDLVAELRQEHKPGQPVPNVGPNHVFCGEPNYEGGPDGEPTDAPHLAEMPVIKPDPKAAGIAVIDTGYDPEVPALHPGLAQRITFPAGSEEIPIVGGVITAEGGHGTFIGGIIMRLAPQVRIRQLQVLSPAGITTDAQVATAIKTAGEPVINLSLGGYVFQDVPPPASTTALRGLNPNTMVIAAAGNHGQQRAFYPAAFSLEFPNVIAVGALNTTNGQPTLAGFSNYSPLPGQRNGWVDVYAPGVKVHSTYLEATWKQPRDKKGWPIRGWAYWNGTSFSAPQVAAAIAKTMAQTGQNAAQAWATVKVNSTQVLPPSGPWPGGRVYDPQPGVIG